MRRVILSKRASRKLKNLFTYLETKWSIKVKSEFAFKFDKGIRNIRKYPMSCKQSDKVKGLRMLVLTKQTSVFYRFDDKAIYVVTIFDTRMDPEKLRNQA